MDKSNTKDLQNTPGATNQENQNQVIDARDSSRNEERDERIGNEQDTERLRSERESTMNRNPE
jgi:hypothetical protein